MTILDSIFPALPALICVVFTYLMYKANQRHNSERKDKPDQIRRHK